MIGSTCKEMKEQLEGGITTAETTTPSHLRKDIEVETQELQQVIKIMLEKESNYLCQVDGRGLSNIKLYTDESQLSKSPVTVTMNAFTHTDLIGNQERYEVVKWMYRVVDHYGFDRETVTIAMSYFDRMLWKAVSNSSPPPCHELLAVTCIYLAVKLFERMDRRSYLLRDLVLMSRRKFTKEEIVEMEAEILSTLSWHVHPTTPQLFSFYFLRVMSRNAARSAARNGASSTLARSFDSSIRKVLEMANFIIELSSFESAVVQERPSAIAGAAIRLAMKELKLDAQIPTSVFCDHDTTSMNTSCCTHSDCLLNMVCDILPSETTDLYTVEEKLSAFLQSHTTTLGDIQASL